MRDRDNVLQRTFGKLCLYYVGGSLLVWVLGGTAVPLVVSLVALGFTLVGYNALDRRVRKQQI